MIVVTGGAGFIGSNLVRSLNQSGAEDVVVVDNLQKPDKFKQLVSLCISDYRDKKEFRRSIAKHGLDREVSAVVHLGACTDTTEHDGRYMLANNYEYSKLVFRAATERQVPFVYASSAAVYGARRSGDSRCAQSAEEPLNVYGYSKLLFDEYIRRRWDSVRTTVVGLRFFNVYGPGEDFKGPMASMPYQLFHQLRAKSKVSLFGGSDGFGPGEQRRDFVHVNDAVDVIRFFTEGPPRHGIVDVGTGESRSFNAVARELISLAGRGEIEYVPFPESLQGRYQSWTQADLRELRLAGYEQEFQAIRVGIAASLEHWSAASAIDTPPHALNVTPLSQTGSRA